MPLTALFALLVSLFSLNSFAKVAIDDCDEDLLSPPVKLEFIFGASTLKNLSLLERFENIPTDVLERYNQEVQKVERVTRNESYQIAVAYWKRPSDVNREKLFKSLQILVPIASRQLLSRMETADVLDDYFQTGYAALWEGIPSILTTDYDKRESIAYWEGIVEGMRKRIFAGMRGDFKKLYSLTPVRLPKAAEFTFEETILLFGETEEKRAKIAKYYGETPEDAEREWRRQQKSIVVNETEAEALSKERTADDVAGDFEARNLVSRTLLKLTPREERLIRMNVMGKDTDETATLDQIGAAMDLSRERVRQIIAKGLRKLKHPYRYRTLLPLVDYDRYRDAHRMPPREYWDVRYRWKLRDEAEQSKIADQLARAEEAQKRELEHELAAALRNQERAEEARVEAIAGLAKNEIRIRKEIAEANGRAVSKQALQVLEQMGKLNGAGDLTESSLNPLPKIQNAAARFSDVSVVGDKFSGASAVEFEAALISDRNQKHGEWSAFLNQLAENLDQVEKVLNASNQDHQAYDDLAENLLKSIRQLRGLVASITAIQDGGETSPTLEASRAETMALLRLREQELKLLEKEYTPQTEVTLNTIRIIFAKMKDPQF